MNNARRGLAIQAGCTAMAQAKGVIVNTLIIRVPCIPVGGITPQTATERKTAAIVLPFRPVQAFRMRSVN